MKKTVKHDASVMAWECFSSSGVGDLPLWKAMNAEMYKRILSFSLDWNSYNKRIDKLNKKFKLDNDRINKHIENILTDRW